MEDAATNPQPIDARDAKIARLEARIAELEAIIEQLRRGGKRQAAPFSRGLPKLNPRKPGRKRGEDYGTPPAFRAMPAPVPTDQVIDAPPPERCPHCGDSSAICESTDEQVQRDIEIRTVVRRFKIRVVRCGRCGKRRRGVHPLQTSAATGCCASQVGPTAQGAMAFMNKTLGLSLGKIAKLFQSLWTMPVTAGIATAAFPNAIKTLLQKALTLRDQRDAGQRSLRSTRNQATRLEHGIRGLCRTTKRNAANERLAAFVHRHAGRLFGYLRQPNLDATNWRGEHAMRYAVVNRKV